MVIRCGRHELAGRLDEAGRVGDPAQGVGGQRPQRRDRHRDAGFQGIRVFRDQVQDRLRGPDIPAHQALGHEPGPQRHRRRRLGVGNPAEFIEQHRPGLLRAVKLAFH